MGFQIRLHEPVPAGIRRIVEEQVDAAMQELVRDTGEPGSRVHEVRKHLKKIRAVLRLVRPVLGDTYRLENGVLRAAGRQLSLVRDAEALVESVDRLAARYRDEVDVGTLNALRAALVRRRERIARSEIGRTPERLEELRAVLAAARRRVSAWPLAGDTFALLAPGLQRTYRQGRAAFREVVEEPDPVRVHQWRKRAKAFWFQTRLLQPVWSPVLERYVAATGDLAEQLGEVHDLDVLRQVCCIEPALRTCWRRAPLVPWMTGHRREELLAAATAAGWRIYAEKPRMLADRYAAYWEAWRREAAPHVVPA